MKSLRAIKICDTATGREKFSIPVQGTNRAGMAFSPDGRRIVSGSTHGIKSWDTIPVTRRSTLPKMIQAIRVWLSVPTGSTSPRDLWEEQSVSWNAATGRKEFTLREKGKCVWSVAYSPDGKRLVAGCTGMVRICDPTAGQQLRAIKRDGVSVLGVAFSPDGKCIAAGVGPVVQLLDVFNGEDIMTLRGHKGTVSSVAFSSDGKRLISGGHDNVVKIWDVGTGRELLTLEHSKEVVGVAIQSQRKAYRLGKLR